MKTIMEFWQEVGFEPWAWKGMEGIYRRVTFRKDSLLGEVATYYADDYIVWSHRGDNDARKVLQEWNSQPEVLNHRFLFIEKDGSSAIKRKSFLFGLKGFVLLMHYCPGDKEQREFRDLIFLANKSTEFLCKKG